jgi:hypothetical protein
MAGTRHLIILTEEQAIHGLTPAYNNFVIYVSTLSIEAMFFRNVGIPPAL